MRKKETSKKEKPNLIKVHYTRRDNQNGPAGESLWAIRLSPKYAKINNIPFFADGVCIDDIVEIDTENEILHVHTPSGKRTAYIRYSAKGGLNLVQTRYNVIRRYMNRHKIGTEGMTPGFLVMAVPKEINEETLRNICERCPRRILLLKESDDHEEDGDSG